jgi:acetylglutamate kinase
VNTQPRVVVVKIGGSTLGSGDTSLEDLVGLQRAGLRVVVVHGGGPAINDWLKKLDTPTHFVRGLRVTDAATLEAVVAVLAGTVNKQLVAEVIGRGGRACGLSGADGSILQAVCEDEELGFVGRVTSVDLSPIEALLNAGFMPILAPIAVMLESESRGAQLLNVNADTVAGEITVAMETERLVFLTDVDGVHGSDGELLRELDEPQADSLRKAGVIGGGMIPKVAAGLRAAAAGADCVILDGRRPGSLPDALSSNPPGTLIQGRRKASGRA